jgi:hypothetical protein
MYTTILDQVVRIHSFSKVRQPLESFTLENTSYNIFVTFMMF